jgi:hypothetical protein
MSEESFSSFADELLVAATQNITQQLMQEIEGADPAYLANVNSEEYLAGLAAHFALSPIVVDVDHPTISSREETVRSEQFDIYSGRQAGDLHTRQIVTIHVAFTGDPEVFRYQASRRTKCPRPIRVARDEVCFDVFVPTHGPTEVMGEVKRMLTCLSENTRYISQEIARFHQSLPGLAKSFLDRRRTEVEQRLGILETLDLPLKKMEAAPATVPGLIAIEGSSSSRTVSSIGIATHSFCVAFSFPGEARHRIGHIAAILEQELRCGSAFYDEWYKSELALTCADFCEVVRHPWRVPS